jgi:hypothetical protein
LLFREFLLPWRLTPALTLEHLELAAILLNVLPQLLFLSRSPLNRSPHLL